MNKPESEYCCIWCHRPLPVNKIYVAGNGTTTCINCRGLGIVLTLWNKPCKRRHSVEQSTAAASANEAEE